MNRRPKLSLVSNREVNKQQALDLGKIRESENNPYTEVETAAPDSEREIPQPKAFRPERLVSEQEKSKHQQSTSTQWPDGGLILKTVLVVATVALSIYVLKRRLL